MPGVTAAVELYKFRLPKLHLRFGRGGGRCCAAIVVRAVVGCPTLDAKRQLWQTRRTVVVLVAHPRQFCHGISAARDVLFDLFVHGDRAGARISRGTL